MKRPDPAFPFGEGAERSEADEVFLRADMHSLRSSLRSPAKGLWQSVSFCIADFRQICGFAGLLLVLSII